jgi:hypothetical protein
MRCVAMAGTAEVMVTAGLQSRGSGSNGTESSIQPKTVMGLLAGVDGGQNPRKYGGGQKVGTEFAVRSS